MIWLLALVGGVVGGNLTQLFQQGKFSLGTSLNTVVGLIGGAFGGVASMSTGLPLYALIQGLVGGFAFVVVGHMIKSRRGGGSE